MVKYVDLTKQNKMRMEDVQRQIQKGEEQRQVLKQAKKGYRREQIQKVKKSILKYESKLHYEPKRETRKAIKRRERAVRGTLTAMGIIQGKQSYAGAGRPKGFTPEQIQQLQQRETMQELEQPSMSQVEQIQQRVQQMQRQPQQFQKMRVPTNIKYIQPGPSVADEELRFRKWSAEQTISPNTQRVLDTIRRIQNKGKTDNIEMQRRLRERTMVMRSMNLMKAHENMIDTSLDFTGVPEDNILFAQNVFKDDGSNNILRNTRGTLSILNTKEAGNNLFF